MGSVAVLQPDAARGRKTRLKGLDMTILARCKNMKFALLLFLACFAAAAQADASCAIIINLAAQRLYFYQDSRVVFVTRLSTGRRGLPTPRGSFQITEKDVYHTSSIYHVSMPYFMRLDGEAFGIHYGYNPGHPASHGCIRVGSMAEAKTLFRMTPAGTSVIID
jgi:lipoprotein-anchoring transpeptidase ErfK/SrfK